MCYGDDCAHDELVEVVSDDVRWPAALVMLVVVMFVCLCAYDCCCAIASMVVVVVVALWCCCRKEEGLPSGGEVEGLMWCG